MDIEKQSTSTYILKCFESKVLMGRGKEVATRITGNTVSKWALKIIPVLACLSLYYLKRSSDTINTG